MYYIADFHIHSKYSRATSSLMDLEHLDLWAEKKGIHILGTGDFTHPDWFANLKEKLEPAEQGLYKLKANGQASSFKLQASSSKSQVRFILTTEISCIYSKKNKVRKIHILVFAPDLQTVEKINAQLSWIGNLSADGRPILGLDAKELVKIVLNVNENCLIVPAHCMTPWFGIFGSKSGFDSVEQCFEDYSKYIYALETGLSADPFMLWRIPDGRRLTLISNSDAHNPQNLGREANVFEGEKLTYNTIIEAIKKRNDSHLPLRLTSTIEFYPEEGKYHYDGHRNCNICFSPKETRKYNGICPKCGKPLTIGVLSRVEQLADKEEGFIPENSIPFKSLVPLKEIIAESLSLGKESKTVGQIYEDLISQGGNEFKILLYLSQEELSKFCPEKIVEGIMNVREGKVYKSPGYDGVYGKISVFSSLQEQKTSRDQGTLF